MAQIRNDQHVFIAGATGSGKTFLAKTYLAGNTKKVFVLDTKGTFEWEQIPEKLIITITRIAQIQNATQNFHFIIYRPVHEELDQIYYDLFFKFCYDLRHCTVYVDEAMQVCPNSFKIPEYYKGILTRGRELDVNVWSCTQRPATLPVVIYSEAMHWFIFKLNALQDRKKIADYSGFTGFMRVLPQHEFMYVDIESGRPPQQGKLTVKKGG